jgi:hypothetical protein
VLRTGIDRKTDALPSRIETATSACEEKCREGFAGIAKKSFVKSIEDTPSTNVPRWALIPVDLNLIEVKLIVVKVGPIQRYPEFLRGPRLRVTNSSTSASRDAANLRFLFAKNAPCANAYCERLVGTIRRECLDFLIPFSEAHLKRILQEFVRHYNRGQSHSSLGSGIPEPTGAMIPVGSHRHKLSAALYVKSTPVLGGLHHEYRLEREAA